MRWATLSLYEVINPAVSMKVASLYSQKATDMHVSLQLLSLEMFSSYVLAAHKQGRTIYMAQHDPKKRDELRLGTSSIQVRRTHRNYAQHHDLALAYLLLLCPSQLSAKISFPSHAVGKQGSNRLLAGFRAPRSAKWMPRVLGSLPDISRHKIYPAYLRNELMKRWKILMDWPVV